MRAVDKFNSFFDRKSMYFIKLAFAIVLLVALTAEAHQRHHHSRGSHISNRARTTSGVWPHRDVGIHGPPEGGVHKVIEPEPRPWPRQRPRPWSRPGQRRPGPHSRPRHRTRTTATTPTANFTTEATHAPSTEQAVSLDPLPHNP